MPCIDGSGKLSESGRRILAALAHPITLEESARETGLPLYRIRSGAREMMRAGLVEEKAGAYMATPAGQALLRAES